MTLSATTIDYFLATLFYDYLALSHADWMALLDRTPTTGTAALDVPDTLVRSGMDLGKDAEYPSLSIFAKEADGNTKARRTVNVSCVLLTWLKADDAGAANVVQMTSSAEAAAIRVTVENRLRDLDAFAAWLATLDSTRLAGWNIISPLVIANAPPSRGEKQGTINYATTITLTVAVSRYAAA